MELVATVYSISTTAKSDAQVRRHCGEEAMKTETIGNGNDGVVCGMSGCDDGGLEVVTAQGSCCCLMVPAAVPIGQSLSIEARFTGINSPNAYRLIVHQHSEILCEKLITQQHIEARCLR